MSKTPIQQAIEQIQKNAKYTALHYQSACDDCIAILTDILPTERDVIEEAWDTGKQDGKDMGYHGRAEHTSANHYFTTKFNDNEKSNV